MNTERENRIQEIEHRLKRIESERTVLLTELGRLQGADAKKRSSLLGRSLDLAAPVEPEEKVALFKRLFCCRKDVFPRFWENKMGKKGYSPVCLNEWVRSVCDKPKTKCSECSHQKFVPLDNNSIKRHLQGHHVAGTYAINAESKCVFIAADFDKDNWREDVSAYRNAARLLGVEAYVEISRSGNGAHAWIFFEEAVSAAKARQLGTLVLSKASTLCKGVALDSHDRFFPNQDIMPSGGFGNLIALPLQRKARDEGKTVFVDDELNPYENQWKKLSEVQLYSIQDIDLVLDKNIKKLDFDGDDFFDAKITEKTLDVVNSSLKPEKYFCPINIRLAEQVFINIENLSNSLVGAFRRTATFANPEFFKKQRMRISTWNIPRFICCSENHGREMSVPRGKLDDCLKVIEKAGASANIVDERPKRKRIKVKFKGKLRPDQKRAVKDVLKFDTGVLMAPPGVGKTVMGCHIIAKRKIPTLVLVHRKTLLEQWIERMREFLEIDPGLIGIFAKNKKGASKIDVAMIQTFSKFEERNESIDKYGQIIVDECHHIPATSFESALKIITARYFVGLTATPYRKDGHEAIIHMQLGPLRHEMEDYGAKCLKKKVFIRKINPDREPLEKRLEIHEIWTEIVNNSLRTEMIVDDVIKEIEEGRHPLVISERKEHISNISKELEKKKSTSQEFVIVGDMKKKEKQKILENIQECIKKDKNFTILSTGSFIGEGFDLPILDTLFMTMPVSFKGRMIQYAGRIHRPHENKKEVRIYDYADFKNGVTVSMLKKRMPVYRKMNYEIIQEIP